MSNSNAAISIQAAKPIDMKIEVIVLPVSDVDRAKCFYTDLGWRLDLDITADDSYRVIQFTPPCSSCSIIFGREDGGPLSTVKGLQDSLRRAKASAQSTVAHAVGSN